MSFEAAISAETPDWSREAVRRFWDPGRKLLRAIRRHQALGGRRGPLARCARRYWHLEHRLWTIVTQCEIGLGCTIGGGLLLPHPTGIVVHPDARIGPNCLLFQQVTLAGEVTLGGHVDVGAGAKLLGPLAVGDHVRIGANAVVTRDVPSRADAVGVPARATVRASLGGTRPGRKASRLHLLPGVQAVSAAAGEPEAEGVEGAPVERRA